MTLREVIEGLGLPNSAGILEPGWDASQRSMTAAGPAFLSTEYVTWACEAAHLPAEIAGMALDAARHVRADEALRALAWYCHENLSAPKDTIVQWPIPLQAMGELAGMFYVLVLLARTRQMQEAHKKLHIPDDIVRETVRDLEHLMTADEYCQKHGQWGLVPRNLDWLKLHWNGTLYQLGRLQYYTESKFQGRVRVFRRGAKGHVVALAEHGIRFRADGQMDGAGGVHDEDSLWTSTLQETEHEVIGNPIHPTGYAAENVTRLSKRDWDEVLSCASDVVAIHIPSGSRLDFDACGTSLNRAKSFFTQHFQHKAFAAFTCHSWLLDTTFDEMLGPESNMVRFQREMYLYPRLYRRPRVVEEAIFGRPVPDLNSVPRETRLERAVAARLAAGGSLHGGGAGFILLDDLDWGSQRYRRQDCQ